MDSSEDHMLNNYRMLVEKVDAHCAKVAADFGGMIACRRGCDGCCRRLSLFPVEAAALTEGFSRLTAAEREHILTLAQKAEDGCPLLHEGLCLLYELRPLICRSHGLPLLIEEEGEQRVDFCPLNFQGAESLPGSSILSLATLNTALATISARFAAESGYEGPERVDILEALLAAGKKD